MQPCKHKSSATTATISCFIFPHPLLYVLYTSDLSASRETTLRAFADDAEMFATHEDPTVASLKLLKPTRNFTYHQI